MNSALEALTARLTQAVRPSAPSATESLGSVRVSLGGSLVRRIAGFAGPGYLVAVGYMDPGNWATALGAGSAHGNALLCVVVAASLIAMALQAAAARLGVAGEIDLAQACRRHYPRSVSLLLWVACEIAIVACNLAEVLGMAVGLKLLFDIPLPLGVGLTALDVALALALQRRGIRALEAFIIALITLIGTSFAIEIAWLAPSPAALIAALLPRRELVTHPDMLYLAIGILGATVMPHNLYLHSALVQTRRHERSAHGVRAALRWATLDSTLALSLALLVNVGILVLAAGVFHRPGQAPVTELADAYRLLSPLLGVKAASGLFGIALIASGLSASITGTLAGQIVMEGFLELRISPVRRALLTRALALGPAAIVAASAGDSGITRLLVLSQVVLGVQLPFALVPLLAFTTRRAVLGEFAFGRLAAALLWLLAALVLALTLWGLHALWR